MATAIIIALIVVAIVAGTIFTLKSTTRMGMPTKDVLDRAHRRSRAQDAQEKTGRDN
jgi:hypothetical protein